MNKYYLTSKQKTRYVIMSMLSILFVLWIVRIFTPSYICLGAYCIVFIFFTFKNIISEHIAVDDKGIAYHRFGLTFNAKWENIKEINMNWAIPFRQEGLHIDPDLIRITEWWLGSYTANSGWSRKAFIPLSAFSESWRESELGQQIKQYAPHLFK